MLFCKIAVVLAVGPVAGQASPSTIDSRVDFLRDVKPILARHCVACHGPVWQRGNLRLDTASAAKSGGDSGPALEPGKPESSLLLMAVQGSGEIERMPREAEPLADRDIEVLRRWIAEGAQSGDESPAPGPADHWAFKPIVSPPVPAVNGAANPIDAFLLRDLEKRNLRPVPAADPARFLRRLYFDLIGLPPTAEELRAFTKSFADSHPSFPGAESGERKPNFLGPGADDAIDAVVNRLLARPQYGERWGRHWMDVWRYSDWYGYVNEVRGSHKHIWRFRDWIVESLNDDVPYDRMVRLMLAADELAPEDESALRATGYLVRSWHRYNRNVWLDDVIEHSGKAFLGLTLNCARCHDHKYDPISHEDYYHLRAFFESHDVRIDVAGNELDLDKSGLSRVYDKSLDPPTFLLERGDEARPRKDRSLGPALPAFFGATPRIEPVELPLRSFYPTLHAPVRKLHRMRIESAVAAAKDKLAKAASEADRDEAAVGVRIAELELQAFDSRVEADLAKVEKRLADADRLARKAARLEADYDLAVAQRQVASVAAHLAAAKSQPPANAGGGPALATSKPASTGKTAKSKSVADLEKELAESQKKLEEVKQRAADPGDRYAPVGPSYPTKSTGRRRALAEWIASPNNPLTARVAVNHVWMRHFGTPLVESMFDFGMNGRPPTHPELLDWLAAEFIRSGWSFKRLHRLIVGSQAYRRSSVGDAKNVAIDPENRFYWRMNSRRLEAEAVRDAILFVSNQLDFRLGGPEIDQREDDVSPRRSIYLRHAKEKQSVFLTTFDAANSTECYRRIQTVAPQQALAMMNGALVERASFALADSIGRELQRGGVDTDGVFVLTAFERLLGRTPSPAESEECVDYLARCRRDPAFQSRPNISPRASMLKALFNHTDFVTVR